MTAPAFRGRRANEDRLARRSPRRPPPDAERLGADLGRQLSDLLERHRRRERGGQLLQALQPLVGRLLALEESRALQSLRRVVSEHGEEHALVVVEGARVREHERHTADGAAVHDERQARIRQLRKLLVDRHRLFRHRVSAAKISARLEEERLAPKHGVAHGQPRLERDARVAVSHARTVAARAHQLGVRGRVVDGPHERDDRSHRRLSLIDDDPRHLVSRHRLAQTAGEFKQLVQPDAHFALIRISRPVREAHSRGSISIADSARGRISDMTTGRFSVFLIDSATNAAVETRGPVEAFRPHGIEEAHVQSQSCHVDRRRAAGRANPAAPAIEARDRWTASAPRGAARVARSAAVNPPLPPVLQAFYGFYAPVEAGLVRLAAAGPPLGFPLRARSELIESDLLALGLSRRELAELPRCADLPRLSCPEDLAGCLYVLEGACLGGQVIAPVLQRRLGLAKGSGASFFVGDAEATAARWILVLAWLEGLSARGRASDEIVAAACATFRTLARWVEQQGASRPFGGDVHGRPDRL